MATAILRTVSALKVASAATRAWTRSGATATLVSLQQHNRPTQTSQADRARSAQQQVAVFSHPRRDDQSWSSLNIHGKYSGGTGQEVANTPWARILIVSRRHLRKGKYVDFVGEYHIDLVQRFGAVPVLIPRTQTTTCQLEAYLEGGVDGVLVMEGQDLGDEYQPYGDASEIPEDIKQAVHEKHAGDVELDPAKDCIEMQLVKEKVLGEGVPYLGLCRGSQMLNVAMGGTLYWDVVAETGTTVKHIDYDNYDGHRHPISVLPNTPLAEWFHEEFRGRQNEQVELSVNSYHHQGIKRLAPGLEPLCFSLDGLLEGFYDPKFYDPENGRYRVGLQWHPERMMNDYAGCPRVYEDFIRAATRHRQLRQQRARGREVSALGAQKGAQQHAQ